MSVATAVECHEATYAVQQSRRQFGSRLAIAAPRQAQGEHRALGRLTRHSLHHAAVTKAVRATNYNTTAINPPASPRPGGTREHGGIPSLTRKGFPAQWQTQPFREC